MKLWILALSFYFLMQCWRILKKCGRWKKLTHRSRAMQKTSRFLAAFFCRQNKTTDLFSYKLTNVKWHTMLITINWIPSILKIPDSKRWQNFGDDCGKNNAKITESAYSTKLFKPNVKTNQRIKIAWRLTETWISTTVFDVWKQTITIRNKIHFKY